MGKVVKFLGVIILLLLVVLIAAPVIFKKDIVQLVKDTANEELNATIDFGDFDLTLISSFPNFTFSIEDVSVANIGTFEGDTLFSAKELSVGLNLMSVIKGEQYKINTISIDHPRIKAIVLKDSTANWDIAKPSTDTTGTATEETESAPFKMSLKKFEILNAYVIYDDAVGGVYADIKGLTHSLSGDFSSDNFVLETLTEIASLSVKSGGVGYLSKVKVRIKADLDADMVSSKYTFKENEISLNALTLGLDGFVAMVGDDINMDLTYKANQTAFKNILSLVPGVYTEDFKDVKTAGLLALNGFAKGTYNEQQLPAFGLVLNIKDAMFHYPSLPKSVQNIQVNLVVDNKTGDPDATVIDLNEFHIEMAGNPVDAQLHVSTPVSDANIDASVKANIDLSTVKDVVPLEDGDDLNGLIAADVKMKGRMYSIENEEYEKFDSKGSLTISEMNYKSEAIAFPVKINKMVLGFTPQVVALNMFDSEIGESDLKLEGNIENFLQYAMKDEMLKGKFNLSSTLLDLNELMAEDSTAAVEATIAATAADTTEAPMSIVEVPSNLDVVLNSSIGTLLYDNLEIKNVTGSLKIKDSKVSMDKLKMDFADLGGSMILSGIYNTQNVKKPLVDFDIDIADFDISKTYQTFNSVKKLAPIGKYAKGKFGTKMKFKTFLDAKMDPDMETLTGGGELTTESAVVEGFEPINKLADALKQSKYKKLTFEDVKASYKFINGRVVVDEMPIKAGDITGVVYGSTGFDQTIDYTWVLKIPRDEFGSQANAAVGGVLDQLNKQAGTNIKLSETVKVKAIFGGTVTKPTIKTGLSNMKGREKAPVKEMVKEKVKEVISQGVDMAKVKAKEEAEQIMRDAQAKATKIKADARLLADKTKKEGYASVDQTVNSASNPIAKKVAKMAAPAAKRKVDEKVAKILTAADKKADAVLVNAKTKSDQKLK